jgi:uncharacterized membrane protein YkvA (DUF1232 family)
MEKKLPVKTVREAEGILNGEEKQLNRKLEEIGDKVKGNPKYSSLLSRWGQIHKYFFAGKVPMKKKVKLLAFLLYIVSPLDLVPGPIDDVLVASLLIPALDRELTKYVEGGYDKPPGDSEEKTPFDFVIDEDELFAAEPAKNPFLIDESEF